MLENVDSRGLFHQHPASSSKCMFLSIYLYNYADNIPLFYSHVIISVVLGINGAVLESQVGGN